MKLLGVLTAALLLAAPLEAGAAGHGVGGAHVGIGHMGGAHGHGFGRRDDHFRNRGGGLLLWGYPYWGWSDCGLDGAGCDWGGDPGAPPGDYASAGGPGDPSCGAWVRRSGGYVWAPDACRDPPTAADPPHPALASNECSDWVWRADLHRSVCKRPA